MNTKIKNLERDTLQIYNKGIVSHYWFCMMHFSKSLEKLLVFDFLASTQTSTDRNSTIFVSFERAFQWCENHQNPTNTLTCVMIESKIFNILLKFDDFGKKSKLRKKKNNNTNHISWRAYFSIRWMCRVCRIT